MPAQLFSPQFIAGIDANRTVKDELVEAITRQRERRRISATDLINLRQAFFRRNRPDIQPPADRLQLMLTGAGFHDLFGRATASEEFVEQFVEFQGIVGKIDIFEELPVELKTTGSLPEDVSAARPSYLDQLGVYCAMVGKPQGRLVLYRRTAYARDPLLVAYRVEYRDLAGIVRETVRRRKLFETALTSGDPTALPRCEWYEIGCDYRHYCGCEAAPVGMRLIPVDAIHVERDCERTEQLLAGLHERPVVSQGFSLNDLVFPRKAALTRTCREEDEPEQDVLATLAQFEREGLKNALFNAMRFGQPGTFTRTPVALRSLRGWSACIAPSRHFFEPPSSRVWCRETG